MVAMRHGKAAPGFLVDLKALPELASRIERRDGFTEIGANTVMTDIEHDPHVQATFPGLVEAAQVVGSVQIRNRATLAGNLVNASPAADTPPVLIALRAKISIAGPDGLRTMPVDEFLVDYRTTALKRGELITAVRIPEPDGPSGSAFIKLGVRRAMEISVVCVGASLTLGAGGEVVTAGIGLGSVAPRTIRSIDAEGLLVGAVPSEDVIAEAASAAGEQATPIDDLRASGAYRKAMVPILVRRALDKAWQRAREPVST